MIKFWQHTWDRLLQVADQSIGTISRERINTLNTQRIYYIALFGMPVGIINILMLLLSSDLATRQEQIWQTSLLAIHFSWVIIMLVFFIITGSVRRRKMSNTFQYVLQSLFITTITLTGVGVTVIDQWITPSITPFLIACTLLGVVLLLDPLHATMLYVSMYVLFYFAIGITQLDPNILVSNRVNGISFIGLGLAVSFSLWKANCKNLEYEQHIYQQKIELEKSNRQLHFLATYDPLTHLLNRHCFVTAAQHVLKDSNYSAQKNSFALVDLDSFKQINDTYGHPVGDQVLKRVAEIFLANLRDFDIVGRWGGEEFIIVLPHTPLESGLEIIERIRSEISRTRIEVKECVVQITASFGVTELNGGSSKSFSESYCTADKALYKAKEKGRNRVESLILRNMRST